MRTGGRGAIQRHEGWEPRGVPDVAEITNFSALGWGEGPRVIPQLCLEEGGKERSLPKPCHGSSSWQKNWSVIVHFFGSREVGAAQNQQTPAPPAPKPSWSGPGTFNKTPVLNSGIGSSTELHGIIREHIMVSDRKGRGWQAGRGLFHFILLSSHEELAGRGENVKIQAGKRDRSWLRAWVCLGQSRSGVATLWGGDTKTMWSQTAAREAKNATGTGRIVVFLNSFSPGHFLADSVFPRSPWLKHYNAIRA